MPDTERRPAPGDRAEIVSKSGGDCYGGSRLFHPSRLVHLAAAMEPGSTAGVLVWENLWAAPFASAARRSGGQLIANGRIPIQAIIASLAADEDEGD